MSQIDIDTDFAFDGGELVPVWLVGECSRDMLGAIRCRVLKAITPDGVDRIADIPQDAMPALEVRLRNAILSARVRDAHEEGA